MSEAGRSKARTKTGQRFPREQKQQSPHSPGTVGDEEWVEREARKPTEVNEEGRLTIEAFPMNHLRGRGRDGSGLSVNRVTSKGRDPKAEEGPIPVSRHNAYGRGRAQVGELRRLRTREGDRTVSVADAGTEENPVHAEIRIEHSDPSAGGRNAVREDVMRVFGAGARRTGRETEEKGERPVVSRRSGPPSPGPSGGSNPKRSRCA